MTVKFKCHLTQLGVIDTFLEATFTAVSRPFTSNIGPNHYGHWDSKYSTYYKVGAYNGLLEI